MPKVVIKEGPGTGNEYGIEQALILGRLETNDVPIKDTKASREHAKIYRQGQQFAIVDLNSSNGTFVNGEKITKRILKPGDEIAIGTVTLVFEAPDEQKPAPAAGRKTLEELDKPKAEAKPAGGGGGGAEPQVVMKGHQPLQFNRIRPGQPLLGIDLDQLSEWGRLVVYLGLIVVFAAIMYVAYILVAG